jgi:tyrosine-protein phosphatase SIW14
MSEGEADPTAIRAAVAALGDAGCQPVYIHCAGGKGRTGTVVAAYRMEMQTWSLRDAKTEMLLFGVRNLVGKVRDFLDGYSSRNRESR